MYLKGEVLAGCVLRREVLGFSLSCGSHFAVIYSRRNLLEILRRKSADVKILQISQIRLWRYIFYEISPYWSNPGKNARLGVINLVELTGVKLLLQISVSGSRVISEAGACLNVQSHGSSRKNQSDKSMNSRAWKQVDNRHVCYQ